MDKLLVIAAILIVAIVVGAPVACTMNRNHILQTAMNNGVDPIAAKCALETSNSMDMLCITNTLAMKHNKEQQ